MPFVNKRIWIKQINENVLKSCKNRTELFLFLSLSFPSPFPRQYSLCSKGGCPWYRRVSALKMENR